MNRDLSRSDDIVNLLVTGDMEDVVLYQMRWLLDEGSAQYGWVKHAAMLALASTEYKGCLHRAWTEQSLLSEWEGWGVRVPHPKTTMAHLLSLDGGDPQNEHRYGCDPDLVWGAINRLLRDQLVAICEVLGIKPGDLIITIDTNTRPNYSKKGNAVRKGFPIDGGLTQAAKWAKKAYRQHNTTPVPLHEGTVLGDEYIVAFAHHVETGGTFPIGVFDMLEFREDISVWISKLLEQLVGLPAPLVVLLDREFYSVNVTRALNLACARLGTTWLMPAKMQGKSIEPGPRMGKLTLRKTVESSFAKAKPMPGAEQDGRVHIEPRVWPGDKRVPFNLAVFYWLKTYDYQPSTLDIDWHAGGIPPNRYATAFITNGPVNVETANWLQGKYGRRWAAESAWSMLEHYFGYSPAKELSSKYLVYGLNLVQYGLYGAWRHRAARELGRPLDDPFLGLAPYLTVLRRRLDLARWP